MRPHPWMAALLVFLASCGSSAANSGRGSATSASSASTASGASSTTSASSPAAPPPTPTACGPAGATTLAADGRIRVYVLHQVVYGCAAGHGRSFRLGRAARAIAQPVVGPVAVAGEVAAYGLRSFGVDTVTASVEVRRLTDGATLEQLPATRAVGAEEFETVGSVVVRPDGAVAWIGSAHSIVGGRRSATEVHAAGAAGDRVLDSGPAIGAASLRLHGTALTWVDGGATRRATLR